MPTSDRVTIEFVADTRKATQDINKLRKVIDRSSKNVENSGRKAVGASKHMRNFGSSVVLINGPLSGLGARAAALNAVMGRSGLVMAGLVTVLAGVAFGLTKVSQAAALNERQMGRINALMKSTGGAARISAGDLEQFAEDLGRSTLQSKRGVLDAAAALLTFRSISGDVFQRTLTLAADVAEVMGRDLRSSVVSLAKALDAPAQNISNLRRNGISFSQSQERMIKSLDASGKKLQAQTMTLDLVEKQIGGAGAGAAGGVIGSVDNLTEAWDELLTTLGKSSQAGRIVTSFLDAITAGLDALEGRFDPIEQLTELATAPITVRRPARGPFNREKAELEAVNEAMRARLELEDKFGVTLFEGRGTRRMALPGTIGPPAEKEVDEVFERRLKALQAQAEQARATSREIFILGKQVALKALDDAEKMDRVREAAGRLFDETQKAARDKRFVSQVIAQATALTDVRVEADQTTASLDRLAEAELKSARAASILIEQIALEEKLKAAQGGIKPLTEAQKEFASRKALETVNRRAAVEQIKIQRGIQQEKKDLEALLRAQKAGNREREIVARQLQIEADLRATGGEVTREQSEQARIQAEQLVVLEENLRRTTAATVDWTAEMEGLTQSTLRGYAQGLLDVGRGTTTFGEAVGQMADNIMDRMAQLAADEVFRSLFMGEAKPGGMSDLEKAGRAIGLDKLFPSLFEGAAEEAKGEAEKVKELGAASTEAAAEVMSHKAAVDSTTTSLQGLRAACIAAAECLRAMCPAGTAEHAAMIEASRGATGGMEAVGEESAEMSAILARTTSSTDDASESMEDLDGKTKGLADATVRAEGAMVGLEASAVGAAGALSAVAGAGGGGAGGTISRLLGMATAVAGAVGTANFASSPNPSNAVPVGLPADGSIKMEDIVFNSRPLPGRHPPFPGFQNEGDLLVGGASGIDANLVALRASRGETISVRNATRQMARGREEAPTIIVKNNISTGVQGTVRAELAAQLPEITRFTTRAVMEGIERGGAPARTVRRRI